MINLSTRKVGGIRFLKLGRLTLAFSVSRRYRPLKPAPCHGFSPAGQIIADANREVQDALTIALSAILVATLTAIAAWG